MVKKIRVWKLGSLEHKVTPTRQAVEKLSQQLESIRLSDEDGYHDLIWGPDIQVIEIPDVSFIENYVITKITTIDEDGGKILVEATKV